MRAETVAETTVKETVATTHVVATLGYARVSTADQSLDAQRERLTEAGAIRIFTDVVSESASTAPASPNSSITPARAIACVSPNTSAT